MNIFACSHLTSHVHVYYIFDFDEQVPYITYLILESFAIVCYIIMYLILESFVYCIFTLIQASNIRCLGLNDHERC